ncbi:putative T7SS-secreted protein [Kitasatospora sp. NPDC088346]|uniref:putative T7SS-secreted protein n=1 Tax=Kitasatospora sp. NPDC088346 TaxID=3364073 RepID=UPI003815BD6A
MSEDSEFPALGFNPAPGRVDSVNALVSQLNATAGSLESAHRTLVSVGQAGGSWQGEAASAFAGKVGELPQIMQDSLDAVKSASGQLDGWGRQLSGYQDTAKRYEAAAQEAKQRMEAAEARKSDATSRYNQAADDPAFSLAGQFFTDDRSLADAQTKINAAKQQLDSASSQLETASRELSQIEDELQDIVKQAKELLEHHQDDAEKTAKALRKANQNAPHTSVWSKIGDGFKKLGNSIKEWATKHADTLKKIGDIAGAASAVLGIAALATMWCPPLSAALGAGAAGASVIAAGAHGLAKLGGANVSWTTIALDGVGALPFVGTAAKGIKGVSMGVKAIATEGRIAAAVPKLAEAGSAISKAAEGGTLMHKFGIGPLLTKTPLRSLPGIADSLDAAGKLSAQSWWSRGIQIGIKGAGLGINAPKLYHEFAPGAA